MWETASLAESSSHLSLLIANPDTGKRKNNLPTLALSQPRRSCLRRFATCLAQPVCRRLAVSRSLSTRPASLRPAPPSPALRESSHEQIRNSGTNRKGRIRTGNAQGRDGEVRLRRRD